MYCEFMVLVGYCGCVFIYFWRLLCFVDFCFLFLLFLCLWLGCLMCMFSIVVGIRCVKMCVCLMCWLRISIRLLVWWLVW